MRYLASPKIYNIFAQFVRLVAAGQSRYPYVPGPMGIWASPALPAVVRDRCQCLEFWHVSFHQFCTQDLRCKAPRTIEIGMHLTKRVGWRPHHHAGLLQYICTGEPPRGGQKCLCHIKALSTINKIGVDIGVDCFWPSHLPYSLPHSTCRQLNIPMFIRKYCTP